MSDGHPDGCLRVCELTAIVFRATRRATIHPRLGRQPARVKRMGRVERVGPPTPAGDPFAPYARRVWFRETCTRCGARFEASHASCELCEGCR